MIPKRERWHYLVIKKLSPLLRGITKHRSDFYCVNCFHSFATEKKGKSQKKVCESKDCCDVAMSWNLILEFNQYQTSQKAPFFIYADLECLIEKIDGCKNKPENSSTTKEG